MARRSRKRASSRRERPRGSRTPTARPPRAPVESGSLPGGPAPQRPPATRRRGRGEPPPAPWGRFPLVELCVLIALVLTAVGFVTGGRQGRTMVACGIALGSLAGLELSIREHFAGFRSHSTLLAGFVAIVAAAAMFFARLPQVAVVVVGGAIFATAFFTLREVFKRRSGGFGFR